MTKKGKSNKPQTIKTAVIVKSAAGDSNRTIAEDLGVSRNTVARILSEAELSQLVNEGKTGIHRLIGKAVGALEKALDKGDTSEAKTILRSVGVLPNEGQGATVSFSLGALAEAKEVKPVATVQ